jgi:hypothetical protein
MESVSFMAYGCLVGELGVLINDDHKRRHAGRWFPYAPTVHGEVRGTGLEDRHGPAPAGR